MDWSIDNYYGQVNASSEMIIFSSRADAKLEVAEMVSQVFVDRRIEAPDSLKMSQS